MFKMILGLLLISLAVAAHASFEACESVGQLKGDAENCQKFYQCTHNGWAPLICQDGLIFNEEISVCDWPKAGTKCGKDVGENENQDRDDQTKFDACVQIGQLKGDSENCEKFYQCTHNGWSPLSCQGGLIFNEEISVCDWPKEGTKCGKETHTDDHSEDEHQEQTDTSKLDACIGVGQLKGDTKNCHKFYQCTHRGWVHLSCKKNLFFNEEISVCDWPKEGTKCGKDTHTDDQSGERNQGQDDGSNLDACDVVGTLKGDEENCQAFYQCTHKGWLPLSCQDGLFFNEDISVCDWPKEGTKCGKDTHTDEQSGEEHRDDDDGSKQGPCTSIGEMKPDEENCQNFYQCTNSGWEKLQCQEGLFFNSKISVCDWPKAGSKCGNDDDSDDHSGHSDDDHDTDLDACTKLGMKKPDTKHCDLYYQCTSCGWSLKPCESGLLFNPKTAVCDKPQRVSCAKDGDLEPCDVVGELKPNEKHCDTYHKCTKCGWALVKCGSGLLFDSKTATCTNSGSAACATDNDDHQSKLEPCDNIGQLKADSQSCDHYFNCTKKGWGSLPCRSGFLFNSKTLACEIASQVKCGNDNDDDHSAEHDQDNHDDDDHNNQPLEPCENIDELKADPLDCNRYYQCTTYGWQNMPCYNNLVFNPNKLICDYSYNFKC